MKKPSILLLIIILIACSCSSKKFIINKDRFNIITPYIEIKEKSNFSFIQHPDKRKALTDFTIEILKTQYPNAEYIDCLLYTSPSPRDS